MSQVIWPAEAIWETVTPNLPGFTVEVLPQIDSTNSELMRRARAGQTDPTLLIAERQNAGRGRLGRAWQDGGEHAVGRALMFSLGLNLQRQDWSGLSLAVGISVTEALRHAGATTVGLKWPNDLWCDSHKLSGILIETQGHTWPRYAVIGIGINILAPVPTEETAFSVPPVGLQSLWPQADAGQALLWIAPALVAAVQQFDADGFAPFQARFNALDVLRDAPVRCSDGVQGTGRGVDATGALRVQTAGGMQTVTSGEVSVRPLHMALPVAPLPRTA
jgi:BirA family biotin operon repressor/biotin-[acetyl-CoA-carboxylase] ligase